ncbi:MAG: hypothetical protein GY931_10125 [Maribacter sp.]|nr:hypothetical protein [Maribacter sp.]
MQTIAKFVFTFILAHLTALSIVPVEEKETEQTISTSVERPNSCKSFKVEKEVVIHVV